MDLAEQYSSYREWVRASGNGYGWMTVAHVAVDNRKDAGFLLQGTKRYANLDTETRRRMLVLRLWTAATTAVPHVGRASGSSSRYCSPREVSWVRQPSRGSP